MDKKSKDRFEITEMFMGKASVDRCFYGCIKRLKDANGNSYTFSRLVVNDGLLCASAPEQQELGDNLDKLCIMVINKNLHGVAGKYVEIFGSKYFLN
jgi:hypothetical protein